MDTSSTATSADEPLTTATRCVVAARGRTAPILLPAAFWFDGAALWMVVSSMQAHALRRDPACVAYVAPPAEEEPWDAEPGGEGRPCLAVRGRARLFDLSDPVGLMAHAPTLATALACLSARNLPRLPGYVQEVGRMPREWLLSERAAVRVTIEDTVAVVPPEAGDGPTPRLPPAVPAAVRRRLANHRQVTVAVDDGGLAIGPATWGLGYALTTTAAFPLEPGRRAAVTVDVDPVERPSLAAGLCLGGELVGGGALRPEHATWWHGFDAGHAEVADSPPGGVELPD